MSLKTIFIISPRGEKFPLVTKLVEQYELLNNQIFKRRLGPQNILNQNETDTWNNTRKNIEDYIEQAKSTGKDVAIFMGFEINKHVPEIYELYKDSATFLISKFENAEYTDQILNERTDRCKSVFGQTLFENIIRDETSKLDSFLMNNNVTWVDYDINGQIFENLNILPTDTPNAKLAILGLPLS